MRQAHGHPVIVGAGEGVRSAAQLEPVRIAEAGVAFNEDWLQRLIHDTPEILPVSELEPGFGRLVSICRELPTLHGPIDNLIMTPDGDIVLVEVKLWRNPEARRKVVAQALDYASCLFEMDYEALEQAILLGQFGDRQKPARLYDLFDGADVKDEASFVDAVNTNLKKGRILILVAGDGIRTEAERLASVVQGHGGAHFTFGLVELAVYQLPGRPDVEPDWLICPRTLARTHMIERAIVTLDDQRTCVRAPDLAEIERGGSGRVAESISAEQFMEAMAGLRPDLPARIREFIAALEPLGVYADYQRSLNLKWDPPSGKPVNLTYISRAGFVQTDAANWFAPHDLSHRYIEELAVALGLDVNRGALNGHWSLQDKGHTPRIADIADKLDLWVPVAARFIEALKERATDAVD